MGPNDNVLKTRFKISFAGYPRLKKLTHLLSWIFSSKKVFFPPTKKKILLYSSFLKHVLEGHMKESEFETFDSNAESLNVYVLLRSFLRKGESRFDKYLDEYIACVDPSLIVTLMDNDSSFYKISSRHEHVKTLFIQYGLRGPEVFGDDAIEKNKHTGCKVDLMCVHGKKAGELYREFIEGHDVCIGAVKNNSVEKQATSKPDTIAVISHFRSKYLDRGVAQFDSVNGIVLSFLSEYAKANRKRIEIIW